ncbi:restriction endonuclease subunit S [Pseudarthrobacter albicanus]|uniref:restriction endonuclease subunit S n=1 Tax=Pseudarthrobacter albicanus TaxID=2823873 RepID=UPI001BA870F4|nr:restriction endonuclease subunit S [Pseudarthrobacter albicanus]
MTLWRTTTIEDLASSHKSALATGPFGSAVASKNFRPSGVPMLRGMNLSDDVGTKLDERDLVFLDPDLAATFGRSTARKDDLVFTCWGSVGQIGLIDADAKYDEYVVSNKQMKLTPDTEQIDSLFLYYNMSQPRMIFEVQSRAIGSTIPGFNLGQLRALKVEIPELSEQQAIAGVLGALDDKIAANTKLVATADQLSHTLFLSMSRSGSRLVPLSETAKFVNGKAFTKNASGTGRVVIRIAELNSGIGGSTVYNDIHVDDQHIARPGDLLFAWSGSLTLARWFRPEGIVNQHIFKVIPNSGYAHWLIYELLRHKLDEFKSIAADKATTMGHIQRKHLDEHVAVPTLEEIHKHDQLMAGLWKQSLAAERENLKLIENRDALLPQLMSGKLRVKDAEAELAKVGV